MAWVEKAHGAHLVPIPCYVQGRQPLDQAAEIHIQPGLEKAQASLFTCRLFGVSVSLFLNCARE